MRVVNLYGGPGTGKSTTCAALFAELKYMGKDVEMVREFAKDLVWQKRQRDMRIKGFIFGEQAYRLATVAPQVECTITDSPLLLTYVYDSNDNLKRLALDTYREYDNLDIFLERTKGYNPNGRNETEAEARTKDDEIYNVLQQLNLDFITMKCDRGTVGDILTIMDCKGWLK